MTTNWRALCAELLDEVVARPFIPDSELISRARDALAEPEPEGPTAMEIIELADEIEAPGVGQVDLVRAALARWGHQPAQPAEGEVAELVRWLRSRAGIPASPDFPAVAVMLNRAADLLEQRHPEPVPVSERLPGPEDCDAGGRCWAWDWLAEKWCLCDRTSACHGFDHWLPAHALPLPAGEVEP